MNLIISLHDCQVKYADPKSTPRYFNSNWANTVNTRRTILLLPRCDVPIGNFAGVASVDVDLISVRDDLFNMRGDRGQKSVFGVNDELRSQQRLSESTTFAVDDDVSQSTMTFRSGR